MLAGHETMAGINIGVNAVLGQQVFPGALRQIRITAGGQQHVIGVQQRLGHGAGDHLKGDVQIPVPPQEAAHENPDVTSIAQLVAAGDPQPTAYRQAALVQLGSRVIAGFQQLRQLPASVRISARPSRSNSGLPRLFSKLFSRADRAATETPIFWAAAETDPSSAIRGLAERFPEEAARYASSYDVAGDEELAMRRYLLNPMNFIVSGEQSAAARHFRIRVGAADADTSLSIAMTLAIRLANAGIDTDYALVWDQPHCDADYPGELQDWIETLC